MKRMGNKKYVALKMTTDLDKIFLLSIDNNSLVNVDVSSFRIVGHFKKIRNVQTDNKVNILFVRETSDYTVSGMVCGNLAKDAIDTLQFGFNHTEEGMCINISLSDQDIVTDYSGSDFEGCAIFDEIDPEDAPALYGEK